jgi:uncharacterized membrane protein YdjX (TVP38/TMEM64 family)
MSLKRYVLVMFGLLVFFLVLFGLAEALQLPFLTDPMPWLRETGPLAMAVGIGLLVVDVLLPVPSSMVMLAHGALFGAWLGTALSLAGCMGAASFGFWLGRRGGKVLERLITQQEKQEADTLLQKWGALALLVTRPLPLLAETTAILAGASPMSWSRMLLSSFLGSLPACGLYAWAGATSAQYTHGAVMFGLVVLIAAIFWFGGKAVSKRLTRSA